MLRQRLESKIQLSCDHVAVKTTAVCLNYGEIGLMADRLAYVIRRRTAIGETTSQGTSVGLLFDHGADAICAVLGAVFSGTTYVPIHADLPLDRIGYMVKHAQVGLIVTSFTHAALANQIRARHPVDVIYLQDVGDLPPDSPSPNSPKNEQPLYLVYTSGSTGRPKAVIQNGENIVYFAETLRSRVGLSSSDRIVMFAHFAFDAGVVDIFSALLSGASLYPFSLNTPSGLVALPEFLVREQITVWHSVPSLFRHFTGSLADDLTFPEVRLVLLGGEPIRRQDVDACRKHFPNSTFGNLYGQTESSINSLWLLPPGIEDYRISLGDPLERTQLLVTGDKGVRVEPLGIGQIVVASRHIAPGYLAEPMLTARVFAEDPDWGRLYWTGDLGRLLPDGRVEFVGRHDNQVKINGIRVELEEVEGHLCSHPDVLNAVVTGIGADGETHCLACYWEPRQECQPLAEPEIRQYLARFFPDSIVPRYYQEMREWPKNANGKINRKALPEIPRHAGTLTTLAASEFEEEIRRIWQRVLKCDAVEVEVNFFDAGGNSLKLLQVQSLFVQCSGTVVPLVRFFEYPTIRKFAAFVSPGRVDSGCREVSDSPPVNLLRARQNRLRKI